MPGEVERLSMGAEHGRSRRIVANILLSVSLTSLASWLWLFELYSSKPERVNASHNLTSYTINNHGRIIYVSGEQKLSLFLLVGAGAIFFISGAIIAPKHTATINRSPARKFGVSTVSTASDFLDWRIFAVVAVMTLILMNLAGPRLVQFLFPLSGM